MWQILPFIQVFHFTCVVCWSTTNGNGKLKVFLTCTWFFFHIIFMDVILHEIETVSIVIRTTDIIYSGHELPFFAGPLVLFTSPSLSVAFAYCRHANIPCSNSYVEEVFLQFTRRVNTKHVWLQENEVTEIVHIIIIVIVMYQYASLSKMCFVYEDATIYISPMQCVAFLLINKPTVHVNWYMMMIQYSFAPKLKPNWFCWHEECMSFWMDTEHGSKASVNTYHIEVNN